MAAYPFTTFGTETEIVTQDGRQVVRATNGAAKARILFSSDKQTFRLVHRLKAAEWTTLNTFYGSNRGTSFTLAIGGGTSTCIFAEPPQKKLLPGGLYSVQVSAEEV